MKKKALCVLYVVTATAVLFCCVCLRGTQTAEAFTMETQREATEILCNVEVVKNIEAVYFLDADGYISCALLKKTWSGYQTLRTSGKQSLLYSSYLCSYYRDGEESRWLDWGIITDESVERIWTELGEMNMAECKPYSYRICWITGEGKEPQDHIEIKNTTR